MRGLSALICALLLLIPASSQAQWRAMGPYGGNARALAYDPAYPDHVLLGSGAGSLFESLDGGRHWRYFAHLGSGNDLMLENVAFDPLHSSTIYVAGWSVSGSGGSFFVTRDGGRSWSEPAALKGKSIQALALAQSDPRILIAGALDGLYRSRNSGATWERISPESHGDLKNFESVAIDPRDPKIIYAGTWHLPWKTTDGGASWNSIRQGVLDDSDVFSIILDRSNPETVYASACSGIYKSEDGGKLFQKVQGIPGTARRTRVLQQDPEDAKTVYAGTTEGLFKTIDGGRSFERITPPDFILNDVLVDPRDSGRLLIATDRGGVYASDDAGASFEASNDGFSERQITSVATDPADPAGLYAGVVNDKEFGGVFHAHSGVWTQMSEGLGGSDVFDLELSRSGQLGAATNHGLFFFDAKARSWQPSRNVRMEKAPPGPVRGRNGKTTPPKPPPPRVSTPVFEGRAFALELRDRRWYAATEAGILHSDDLGASWSRGPHDPERSMLSVSAHDRVVASASVGEVWYSPNYGQHWTLQPLPAGVTRVYSVTVTGDDTLWAATREGALRWLRRSLDEGHWEHVENGLPAREVTWIREQGNWLLAAVAASRSLYVSRDQGRSWKPCEPAAPFEVTGALLQGERLYLVSRHHGVLLREPEVASKQPCAESPEAR
ncbi:MAG: transcriptional regulator [Candidatus Korobacteraceae bacterium]